MSNFTDVLKKGFDSLEAELEAGLIENDNSEADDNVSDIKTDIKLSEIDENDLFDMNEDNSSNPDMDENEPQEAPLEEEENKDTDDKGNDNDEHDIGIEEENILNDSIEETAIDSYNRVWEFFREWNGLTKDDRKEITGGKDILSFTPIEAFTLLEDWKESKRIHIGDIITNNGVTGICVEISIKDKNGNDCYLVSTGDEKLLYFDKESTLKTEKHIDIKKLL
mgnify:CR=1 FL=1|jgi:hypothetical protein